LDTLEDLKGLCSLKLWKRVNQIVLTAHSSFINYNPPEKMKSPTLGVAKRFKAEELALCVYVCKYGAPIADVPSPPTIMSRA
jgi:hypothetical protein